MSKRRRKEEVPFAEPLVRGRTRTATAAESAGRQETAREKLRAEEISRAATMNFAALDRTTLALLLQRIDNDSSLANLCSTSARIRSVCTEHGDLRIRWRLEQARLHALALNEKFKRERKGEGFAAGSTGAQNLYGPRTPVYRPTLVLPFSNLSTRLNARDVVQFFQRHVVPILTDPASKRVLPCASPYTAQSKASFPSSSLTFSPDQPSAPTDCDRMGESEIKLIFNQLLSAFIVHTRRRYPVHTGRSLTEFIMLTLFDVISRPDLPGSIAPSVAFPASSREKLLRDVISYAAPWVESESGEAGESRRDLRAAVFYVALADLDRAAWFWNSFPLLYPTQYDLYVASTRGENALRAHLASSSSSSEPPESALEFLDYFLNDALIGDRSNIVAHLYNNVPEANFQPALQAASVVAKVRGSGERPIPTMDWPEALV